MSTDTAASIYTVPAGPFKGVTSIAGEISVRQDYDREYQQWDTHARTRHFLDVFSPLEGWRIELTEIDLDLQMVDSYTRDALQQPVYQPAWKFTASLKDKEGHVVNTASVVQLLNCPGALEMGQTRARGKLYTALGLPSSPGRDLDEQPPFGGRAAPAPVAMPKVEIIPVEDDKASASADAVETAPEPVADVSSGTTPAADAEAAPTADPAVPATDAVSEHDVDQEPALPAVTVVPQAAPSAPVANGVSKADAKVNGKVPAGLLKQIQQRAARAKVSVPEFSTVEQASAFLATLVNPTQPILGVGEGS